MADGIMKNNIIIGLSCLLIGALSVKFFFPTIQEKIVEKEVQVVSKDIKTEIREIVKPDGTKETVTVIVDKSKEKTESSKVVTVSKPDWHISASVLTPNTKDYFYQAQIERRVLGNIHVGIVANTQGQFGLAVGYEF